MDGDLDHGGGSDRLRRFLASPVFDSKEGGWIVNNDVCGCVGIDHAQCGVLTPPFTPLFTSHLPDFWVFYDFILTSLSSCQRLHDAFVRGRGRAQANLSLTIMYRLQKGECGTAS